MCMEDIRIGRKTLRAEHIAPAPSTNSFLLIPGAPKRILLMIAQSVGNPFTLAMNTPVVLQAGLHIFTTVGPMYPIQFNIRDHGDLVTSAWYCIATNTTNLISWWEVLLADE